MMPEWKFKLHTQLIVCAESKCPLRGKPLETHPEYGHCKVYPCIKSIYSKGERTP